MCAEGARKFWISTGFLDRNHQIRSGFLAPGVAAVSRKVQTQISNSRYEMGGGWAVGGVPPYLRLEHKITRFLRFGSPMVDLLPKILDNENDLVVQLLC